MRDLKALLDYRTRAQELRVMAAGFADEYRQSLLKVAETYDTAAISLERSLGMKAKGPAS
jgi:hypothetical protein